MVISCLQANQTQCFQQSVVQNTAVKALEEASELFVGITRKIDQKTCRGGTLRGVMPTLKLSSMMATETNVTITCIVTVQIISLLSNFGVHTLGL